MSTASDLANQIANKVNTDFSSGLTNCLTKNGISEDIVNQIKGLYENILDANDISSIENLIQENLDEYTEDLTKVVKATQSNIANSTKSTGPNSDYQVQDAVYGKEIPTVSPPITKFASVPDFPPANSELSADYPNQYGHIDDAANWYKVNKKEKSVEFVHSSGTSLKVNKTGDVALYIAGSLQLVVNKDMVLNVLGNYDEGVGGNKSETITGDRESKSARHINKAGSLFKVTAASVELN